VRDNSGCEPLDDGASNNRVKDSELSTQKKAVWQVETLDIT